MRPSIIILTILLCPVAFAATIHVPVDYATIQEAIDAAVNGDTILVAPGTYVENINFKGKKITVASESGPEVTTIDGGNPPDPKKASVVTFRNNEGLDSVLDGFTITNGNGTYIPLHYRGGGILCKESSPTIVNNIIVANYPNAYNAIGGGIYCGDSTAFIAYNLIQRNTAGGITISSCPSPLLRIEHNSICMNEDGGITSSGNSSPNIMHNSIYENTNTYGGGICIYGSSPVIAYNAIYKNVASNGGGISFGIDSSVTVCNNIIYENRANSGGGIRSDDSSAHFENNLLFGNHAYGYNYGGGGIDIDNCTITITNNIIYKNTARGLGWGGGGGVMIRRSSGPIVNNTIFENTVKGPWGGGGICSYDSTLSIANTICWNNIAPAGPEIHTYKGSDPVVTYCDIKGGWPGIGNIDSDPLFLYPANNDFHLTFNSPCRGSGDNAAQGLPEFDFEGDPRICQGTVDIGADECYRHLYCMGDFTPGGSIDGKLVGLPGTTPVGLLIGSGIRPTPAPTAYGEFWLLPPRILIPLAPIPSNGILAIPATIPQLPPAPYDIPMQALIGLNSESLTNLCVLEVR